MEPIYVEFTREDGCYVPNGNKELLPVLIPMIGDLVEIQGVQYVVRIRTWTYCKDGTMGCRVMLR